MLSASPHNFMENSGEQRADPYLTSPTQLTLSSDADNADRCASYAPRRSCMRRGPDPGEDIGPMMEVARPGVPLSLPLLACRLCM